MNKNEELTNDEEISLIDLFAVVLRYRVLIIIGTLIITLVAGLYLFVLPKVNKTMDTKTASVTYTVKVGSIPQSIIAKLSGSTKTPVELAVNQANRLQFLAEEFKEYPIFSNSNSDMSEYEFNAYVQQVVSKKQYISKASELGNELDIQLVIPMAAISDSALLVNDIVTKIDAELNEYYAPLLKELEQNTALAIEKAEGMVSGTTDLSSLQTLQSLAIEIESFNKSHTAYLTLNKTPFVVPNAGGRVKKLVMICFASFMMLVIVAFVLNAIENIKADPQSSKAIADAWNAGKVSKKN